MYTLVDFIVWDRKFLYMRISIGQEKVITLLLGLILLIVFYSRRFVFSHDITPQDVRAVITFVSNQKLTVPKIYAINELFSRMHHYD